MPSTSQLGPSSDSLVDRLRRATIGRYDVYAELGSGGMATVFLALDLALDRKVAIKVLSPELAKTPENVERFKREAKVAAALNHPNVIAIYGVGDDPDLAYFVMKYVEGRALDSVVSEEGAQSVGFVQSVIGAAGKALRYAHGRGVIHRDVKPANLMLDQDGWLVVTDFGIAKVDDARGLTMTGNLVGTPFYMAPELFQGKAITAAADQYALGVVAFELLAATQPFGGDTVAEVVKGHLFDPIPSVRTLRPDVPERLDACITRMLAKEPAERFPSLDEAVRAFGAVPESQEHEVRTQIIQLATSGAMQRPQISVPASPVPAGRQPASAAVPNPATAPASAPVSAAPPSGVRPAAPRPATAQRPRPLPPRRSRATAALVLAAVLVGAIGATAMLRPDLVQDGRAWLGALVPAFAVGDDAAGAAGSGGSPPAPAGTAPSTPGSDPAVAFADSVARAADLARADSAARADSMARADSIARAIAAAAARRRREQQDAARRSAATPAPTLPPAPALAAPGLIRIGSRFPRAVLTFRGEQRQLGGEGIVNLRSAPGTVSLSITTPNCPPWDTTFTVESNVVHTIGYRPIRCRD